MAMVQIRKVGMEGKLNHYPKQLSGGQQQRVAIARALAMEPKLLLMDEPTSALDPELVSEVLLTIKEVAQEGNTILLVTHEMSFVGRVADRIIFLEGGKVVAYGTPREVFNNPKNPRLREFLGKMDLDLEPEYFL
jgi:polar amino acid transport system ATP-binding protein